MSQLHLSEKTDIIKDGKLLSLRPGVYNISDEKIMKENNLFKCHKCKDWFDVICECGQFHPSKDKNEYCQKCFNEKYPCKKDCK